MSILPDCEIGPLSECGAGKLVRLIGHWGHGEFALVADLKDSKGRGLVLFQERTPVYEIVEYPTQFKALIFSSDWIFEVDQHGPYEPIIRDLYEMPGCVIREERRWLLNVREVNTFRPNRAQYDLETYQLVGVSQEYNSVAIIGKWSLYLGDRNSPREEWIRIAAFEWKPPEERDS